MLPEPPLWPPPPFLGSRRCAGARPAAAEAQRGEDLHPQGRRRHHGSALWRAGWRKYWPPQLLGLRHRGRGCRPRSAWSRADAPDELGELLLHLERDLWVLMGELATDPSKRGQAHPRAPPSSRTRWSPTWNSSSMTRTIGSTPPTEFVVPGQNRGRPARRGPHGGPLGEALTPSPWPSRRARSCPLSEPTLRSVPYPRPLAGGDPRCRPARWARPESVPSSAPRSTSARDRVRQGTAGRRRSRSPSPSPLNRATGAGLDVLRPAGRGAGRPGFRRQGRPVGRRARARWCRSGRGGSRSRR